MRHRKSRLTTIQALTLSHSAKLLGWGTWEELKLGKETEMESSQPFLWVVQNLDWVDWHQVSCRGALQVCEIFQRGTSISAHAHRQTVKIWFIKSNTANKMGWIKRELGRQEESKEAKWETISREDKEVEREREKVGACTTWQCGLPTINQERQIRNSNDIFFVLTKQCYNLWVGISYHFLDGYLCRWSTLSS